MPRATLHFASLLSLALACSTPALAQSAAGPKPIGPYSPLLTAGDLVFLSGQIAIDPATGKLDPATSTAEQTTLILKNIRKLLKTQGLDLAHIVQSQVYLTDMGDFQSMNAAYIAEFGDARPTRTTVGINALALGAKIEITVVASRKR
jgi:2-iminobutanoate/2-iminopropanoate deaminase